jgi:arsenate reductase
LRFLNNIWVEGFAAAEATVSDTTGSTSTIDFRESFMLKFYGYKKCSTCRQAEKQLQKLELNYEFIDITQLPPSAVGLQSIYKRAGVALGKLLNTSGVQYRELKIRERLPHMSEGEVLELLASNGRLVKRPLVTDGKRATVGYKEEQFVGVWGAPSVRA